MVKAWFTLKNDGYAIEFIQDWESRGWKYVGKFVNAKQEIEYLFEPIEGVGHTVHTEDHRNTKYKSIHMDFV